MTLEGLWEISFLGRVDPMLIPFLSNYLSHISSCSSLFPNLLPEINCVNYHSAKPCLHQNSLWTLCKSPGFFIQNHTRRTPCLSKLSATSSPVAPYPAVLNPAKICTGVCPIWCAANVNASARASQRNVLNPAGAICDIDWTPCLFKLFSTSVVLAAYPFLHSSFVICGTVRPSRFALIANASAGASKSDAR